MYSESAWLSPWCVYVLVGGYVAYLICLILDKETTKRTQNTWTPEV